MSKIDFSFDMLHSRNVLYFVDKCSFQYYLLICFHSFNIMEIHILKKNTDGFYLIIFRMSFWEDLGFCLKWP